ncbi:MAG: tetratricopeptide repeat protein [Flavobacteriales bacterium]|nr:tetratricopeptide repeat protein [Flavobacteriales bacterium]
MCWACDRAAHLLVIVALMAHGGAAHAAPGDTLSLKDKGLINAHAESLFKRYIALLDNVAGMDAADDESAMLVQQLIANACEPGRDRMFLGPQVRIEDNVDPANDARTAGRDRPLAEYMNDLLLYFQSTDPLGTAVEARLLKKREPAITDRAFTQVLYELRFLGRHSSSARSYERHLRVLELVAERRPEGGWDVAIATDNFFAPGSAFAEALMEQDIDSLARAGRGELGELSRALAEYRGSFDQALRRDEEERAQRRKAYADAVSTGRSFLERGDHESAMTLFEQARTLDPLAVEPLVLINEVKRAMERKRLKDEAEAAAAIEEGGVLTTLRCYDRAIAAFERADRVKPGDASVKARIDGLRALAAKQAEREKLYRMGDLDKALAEVQAARNGVGRSDDPDLTLLHARILIARDQNGQALQLLGTLLERMPDHVPARDLRASLLERSTVPADRQTAASDLYTLRLKDRWNPGYDHRLAMLLCQDQGKCTEAIALLEETRTRWPFDLETRYQQGVIHLMAARPREALDHLDEALTIDEDCARCHVEKGLALFELDSIAAGERSLERGRAIGLDEAQRSVLHERAAHHLEKAHELQALNANAEADRHFRVACALRDDQPDLRLEKARNLMRIDRYAEAIHDLDQYIASSVTPFVGILERGHCRLGLGEHARAMEDFDVILRNNVERMKHPAMLGKARAHYAMGDAANAESLLKAVLKEERRNAEVLSMLSRIARTSGRLAEAKELGEQAVDADKDNAELHYELGLVYQALRSDEAAVKCFDRSIELGKDKAEAKKQMGRAAMLAGNLKEAVPQFDESLRIRDDVEAARWRAECLRRTGDARQALEQLNLVYEKNPALKNDVTILADLAYLYVLNDMLPLARDHIDRAQAADPLYRYTQLVKACYLHRTGQTEDAATLVRSLVNGGEVKEEDLRRMDVMKEVLSSKAYRSGSR